MFNPSKNAGGWETLLDAMDGYDDKMLDDWKEELANLLTFVRDESSTLSLRC